MQVSSILIKYAVGKPKIKHKKDVRIEIIKLFFIPTYKLDMWSGFKTSAKCEKIIFWKKDRFLDLIIFSGCILVNINP